MKNLIILLSTLSLTFTAYATNSDNDGGHRHEEVTTNGLSSGEITNNIIVVNVNGMVCDFCARGIEKTFMKSLNVKKIDVDLEVGKVLIAYTKGVEISFKDIKEMITANGQTAIDMKVFQL
jgi:hypothetical protein